MRPEPAGDLVDLILSGAIPRPKDKINRKQTCSTCGLQGHSKRRCLAGEVQPVKR